MKEVEQVAETSYKEKRPLSSIQNEIVRAKRSATPQNRKYTN
jgi:hypothetical protein